MISIDTVQNLTDKALIDYFKGRRRSPIYEECKRMYEELKIHADGLYPYKLIEERRPHESEAIHAFRKSIYQSKTKETITSVITSLGKIRRSSDWSIEYDSETQNSAIPEDETLFEYCEKKFPYYGSLTMWVFGVLLKEYLIDPNGLIVVCPLARPQTDQEYLKPYPIIFNSDQILDYIENQYAVLKSLNKYQYTDSKSEMQQGDMWYVVKANTIETWAEADSNKNIKLVDSYDHNLGYIPIIRIKGIFLKTHEEYSVWESRISSMTPSLNEAVREYSDLQGAKVGALYPEKWEWASQPCMNCKDVNGIATGKIIEQYGKQQKQRYITCPSCQGTGSQGVSGPYKKFIVRSSKENMGESPAPIPPFGYVAKGDVVAIIDAMEKSVNKHKFDALSSINMQFLTQVPLAISGEAKQVDRDELNNFVYTIAEDIVGVMDMLYWVICDYRYRLVVPDLETRRELCPDIPVPQKFDLLSSQYLIQELGSATQSGGLSDITLKAFEIDFCSKKFSEQPAVKEELELNFKLDPLAAKTEDEKLAIKQGGGCREIDYIISCNIGFYVKRALTENEDFCDMNLMEQVAILEGYAANVISNNSMKQNITAKQPPITNVIPIKQEGGE